MWEGFVAEPWRLLVFLGGTFLLLLGYNRYAGLRRDASWTEVAIDSVEELGLGVITAAIVLYAIGRIGPQTSFPEALGQILIEAGVVAVGFSVGTAQLGAGEENGDRGLGRDDDGEDFGGQLVVAFCGAVLFAANVAPTEEIVMIAVESGPVRLLLLAMLSMALAALVLYFSDFARATRYSPIRKKRQAFRGMVITYAVGLVASAAILWFFGRFDDQALDVVIAQTVVLGFPATLGASAGRLLLQS